MAETVIQPQLEYLPEGAEYIGSFQARESMGIDFDEPRNVTYLDAPLVVYATDLRNGTRFDVIVDHHPLSQSTLLGFLKKVAPNKDRFADIAAVVSDWEVIDRASGSRRPWVNQEDKELVKLHRHLGEAWKEFMLSRKTFLEALKRDGHNPDLYDLFYCCSRPEDISTSGLARDLIVSRSKSLDDMLGLLDEVGVENPEENLLSEVNYYLLCKAPIGAEFQRIEDLDDARRVVEDGDRNVEILSRAMGAVSDEQREKLAQQASEALYDKIQLEDGTVFMIQSDRLRVPLEKSYKKRHTVIDGPYTKEVITVHFSEGDSKDLTLPGTVKRVIPDVTLNPAISWVKQRQGRRFVLERQTSTSTFQRIDGVLGVLAVAYFSPDLRSSWPTDMSIRASRDQFMGPAQVPVLALMRRPQLLKSPFVEVAESIVA